MSHEITLPSGSTVTVKDADDITFGDREDITAQFDIDPSTGKVNGSGGTVMNQFQRAAFVMGVESWAFTDKATGEVLPIPAQDPASVRQLSARDGAYLFKQLEPLIKELFPDFSVNPSADSPSSPSVA